MGQNSGLLSSLTDWNSTLAGYADSISTGVVMPVALTLLALFMILELYNATQRIAMNGSNNAFTIQQIALVMLKIVVCRWAVVHTTEILNALFEVASTVTVGISGYVGSGEVNTTVDIENAIAALPGGIGNMPVALELMVVGWMLRIVNIVVNTIVAARFIELYVYNAMASLSIATLCYQELHGIAVNFLKSYLAVASQGAVLYLVIGQQVNLIPVACVVIAGFLLVVCFGGMAPDKTFGQGLKAGLGNAFTVFLNTISAFGNIMSYIRLFAVGMASLAIAQSFNNMALGFKGPLVVVGILIMLVGHGLNIVMGLLSVVVHGVRLNLLEFSGQLGMEWTGTAYAPFKKLDKIRK